MYSRTFFILILFFAFIAPASATIWVVNSNPGSPDADFVTLQEAHDGANAGDTLYVMGSPVNYGALDLSKTLYIYGPGYFLAENPETRADIATAKTEYISFHETSSGSMLMGLDINGFVRFWTNDIILQRNMIVTDGYTYDRDYIIGTGLNVSNILILQNYIRNTSDYGGCAPTIWLGNQNSDIIIRNNYIERGLTEGREALISPSGAESITIEHNVFLGSISVYNATFRHNILRDGEFWASNCIVTHNIGNSTQFGSDDGNQSNVDMNTVFINAGSTDGRWQLAEGSPALDAGENGVDIGMFGGSTPYVLSGITPMPSVYFFDAPPIVGPQTDLNIRVKIKSND
ncbi:MAG: hypothetical protein D6675_06025 [Gemmatimonadetes bacterium]|nr:MAG: hypothetical protein D6675_06025 [Gemmatimonadota bacterium]